MFRSQDVQLYQVNSSRESAWDVLNFLGLSDLTMIEETELSDAHVDKNFSMRIRGLDDWIQKLDAINQRVKEFQVEGRVIPEDYNMLGNTIQERADSAGIKRSKILEKYLLEAEEKVTNLNNYVNNYENFISKITELKDAITILENIKKILPAGFESGRYTEAFDIENLDIEDGKAKAKGGYSQQPKSSELPSSGSNICYFAGLIDTSELLRFKRIVFRMSRGNVVMSHQDIYEDKLKLDMRHFEETDQKGKPVKKTLIFIVYLGRVSSLASKLRNVALAFNVFCLTIPPSQKAINEKINSYKTDFDENMKVYEDTYEEVRTIIRYFMEVQADSEVSRIEELIYLVNKEKKISSIIASMNSNGNIYSFKFWLDSSKEKEFMAHMEDLESSDPHFTKPETFKMSYKEQRLKPPTLFKLNEFTAPFQQIIETYGIPKFKEVNPGYFTIVTFPFQFGVMFGDFGHGLLLLLFGLYLVFAAEKLKKSKSLLKLAVPFRYMFSMMGFFSFYNGLIYNDAFSVHMPLFSSCYTKKAGEEKYIREENCNYIAGIDYVWGKSDSEIAYYNSFKMKLSIIIGVTHMMLGILMKGVNAIYFGSVVDLIFEFIPQFLFMGGLFGYMCFLIIVKWVTNWRGICTDWDREKYPDLQDCPAIIGTFTAFTSVKDPIFASKETQQSVQMIILIVALVCVIAMLCFKPFILASRAKQHVNPRSRINSDSTEKSLDIEQPLMESETKLEKTSSSKNSKHKEHHDDEEHSESLGELFIHQLIETIEFVLGSISNTASYLRLWALSLAHSQLASVFLSLIMANNYKEPSSVIMGVIMIIPTFAGLSVVTFGVLMLMDMMECFLHTLRLHWVEFQNKFFKGEGLKFTTFNFDVIKKED